MNYNYRPLRQRISGLAIALLSLAATGDGARAADSAAVIMYHRFGESDHPATNIRLKQFEAHLEELTSGRYTVLPLPEIVEALKKGQALPDRAVAITIDDAYRSVYTEAWPRLRRAGLPFTLFVATEAVTEALPDFMTWQQVRELRDAGVTIGAHTHTHLHMAASDATTNRAEIARSNRLFEQHLGAPPALFAYPYGESSAAVERLVRAAGYVAAFGQHSGAMAVGQSPFYLPRFPLNEAYGELNRLRLVANALPIPVRGVTPTDPLVSPDANPPAFGFTVDAAAGDLSRISCYHSLTGKARIERLGNRRIEVRFERAFASGRSRVNCTMPGPSGRWRWFGMQFYVKP